MHAALALCQATNSAAPPGLTNIRSRVRRRLRKFSASCRPSCVLVRVVIWTSKCVYDNRYVVRTMTCLL
jgi:hypothetical protein